MTLFSRSGDQLEAEACRQIYKRIVDLEVAGKQPIDLKSLVEESI